MWYPYTKEFEKHLFASLEEYTTPIPGVIEVIEKLKRDGIKIGSTTGYTTAMMDIVLPGAATHGYTTDNCVTSNNLPAGRPQPYMIYQNMIDLAIPSVQSVIKYSYVRLSIDRCTLRTPEHDQCTATSSDHPIDVQLYV